MSDSTTATTGTRVTCEDIANGDMESVVIRDDYVVIVDGNTYVDGLAHYPSTGTTVLTIKRKAASA